MLRTGSERRFVTILFTDIVDSSAYLKTKDVEDAENLFSTFIDAQIRAVRHHAGTVNQVMGDGLMCLFGAEKPYENAARNALAAAQDIIQTARQKKIKVRVAVHAGEVLLKTPEDADYSVKVRVVGDAVHICDRMLKLCTPNMVLTSDATIAPCKNDFTFKKTGAYAWKDKAPKITLYMVGKRKTAAAAPLRGPLLRTQELQDIQKYLGADQTTARNRNVLILAEAGMGKSFLTSAFCAGPAYRRFARVIPVYHSAIAAGYGSGRMIHKIAAAVKAAPHSKDILAAAAQKQMDGDSVFMGRFVKACLGIGDWAALGVPLNEDRRDKIALALLSALTEREKTLLIVEDLHWANEQDLRLFKKIVEGEIDNLYILSTSRSIPGMLFKTVGKARIIKLSALSRRDAAKMIGPVPERYIRDKVIDICAGNPLFLTEYRAWLRKSGHEKTLLSDDAALRLPEKIEHIAYSKTDGLSHTDMDMLRWAAACGADIDARILAAVTGQPRKKVFDTLHTLEMTGLIRFKTAFPAATWEFHHDILRRAIYQTIPHKDKAARHKTIVKKMTPVPGRLVAGKHAVIAWHADRSGSMPLAHAAHMRAAAQEEKEFSYKGAERHFLRARDIVQNQKKSPRHKLRVCRINDRLIRGNFIFAAYDKAQGLLRQQKTLLAGTRNPDLLKSTLSFEGLYHWIKGRPLKAIDFFKKSLDINKRNFDLGCYIREHSRLANIYLDLGRLHDACVHDEHVIGVVPAGMQSKFGLLTLPRISSLSSLTLSYQTIGQDALAATCFDEAFALTEDTRDEFTKTYAYLYLGQYKMQAGAWRQAESLLNKAWLSNRAAHADILAPFILSALGVCLARSGQIARGESFCREALRRLEDTHLVIRSEQFKIWLAETLFLKKDMPAALRVLNPLLKTPALRQQKQRYAEALRLMAFIHARKTSGQMHAARYARKAAAMFRQVPAKKQMMELSAFTTSVRAL